MILNKLLLNLVISCTAAIFGQNIYANNPVGKKELAMQLSSSQTSVYALFMNFKATGKVDTQEDSPICMDLGPGGTYYYLEE